VKYFLFIIIIIITIQLLLFLSGLRLFDVCWLRRHLLFRLQGSFLPTGVLIILSSTRKETSSEGCQGRA